MPVVCLPPMQSRVEKRSLPLQCQSNGGGLPRVLGSDLHVCPRACEALAAEEPWEGSVVLQEEEAAEEGGKHLQNPSGSAPPEPPAGLWLRFAVRACLCAGAEPVRAAGRLCFARLFKPKWWWSALPALPLINWNPKLAVAVKYGTWPHAVAGCLHLYLTLQDRWLHAAP